MRLPIGGFVLQFKKAILLVLLVMVTGLSGCQSHPKQALYRPPGVKLDEQSGWWVEFAKRQQRMARNESDSVRDKQITPTLDQQAADIAEITRLVYEDYLEYLANVASLTAQTEYALRFDFRDLLAEDEQELDEKELERTCRLALSSRTLSDMLWEPFKYIRFQAIQDHLGHLAIYDDKGETHTITIDGRKLQHPYHPLWLKKILSDADKFFRPLIYQVDPIDLNFACHERLLHAESELSSEELKQKLPRDSLIRIFI
jgi:hypothetical protein